MISEMVVHIELCVVSSCDVSQCASWVRVFDPLFIDQYALLLGDIYEECHCLCVLVSVRFVCCG